VNRTDQHPLPPTPEDGGLVLDLFAGPGGWSTGLRALGLHDIGVEWDAAACATRAAEGHLTIHGDVSVVPTAPFRGRTHLLLASPPCQSFSVAGKRQGRPTAFLDALAGRYDEHYAAQLRLAIAGEQQARDQWNDSWRREADLREWWAGSDAAEAAPVLPGMPYRSPAPTMTATPDGLSSRGAAERLRLLGPAPQVEDERGMYMAETVRWITHTDHPTKVALERVRPVILSLAGTCFKPADVSSQVTASQRMLRKALSWIGGLSRQALSGVCLQPPAASVKVLSDCLWTRPVLDTSGAVPLPAGGEGGHPHEHADRPGVGVAQPWVGRTAQSTGGGAPPCRRTLQCCMRRRACRHLVRRYGVLGVEKMQRRRHAVPQRAGAAMDRRPQRQPACRAANGPGLRWSASACCLVTLGRRLSGM
jgi:hypothetical protein